MRAGLQGWTFALVATLVAAFTLTACSGSAASQIEYVVDGRLVTYNTNTVGGAASEQGSSCAVTVREAGAASQD